MKIMIFISFLFIGDLNFPSRLKQKFHLENNIFQSIHNVQLDTLAEYKKEGKKHSFLEKFQK